MSQAGESDERDEAPWADLQVNRALRAASPWVMPPQSIALYARWWQLETWLRELVYVELRALYGVGWIDVVKTALVRQTKDAALTHMVGADNDNPLAYLDYSQLVQIMGQHWEQFGYALLEEGSWNGRQNELTHIRHRIGHLRKPHPDDLGRIEQTLRDLERGAFIAFASYNDRRPLNLERHHGAVIDGWLLGQHLTAQRLVEHAARQYETNLQLNVSRRPWSVWPSDLDNAAGALVHVEFSMRRRIIDARTLWHDDALNRVRPLLVHLLADGPSHVEFTFSAVDDPEAISDAIGRILEAVIMVSRAGNVDEAYLDRLRRRARNVDYRVLSATGWNIVDDSTLPISSFGAGRNVESAPPW